ncbi:uncharacterized protein N7503_004779 [Penicillium pulvis]|uniref:uncharacterized protein n=1 Tax=Penicillium pulvis TaxID=1562058 RepID=UPI00254970D1|nr:uncharacterized protein N7503_004779 [Penicillium pulvis]KAJ5802329.1 hypothetical protein N7503_004779 [Penicillium pulvis]
MLRAQASCSLKAAGDCVSIPQVENPKVGLRTRHQEERGGILPKEVQIPGNIPSISPPKKPAARKCEQGYSRADTSFVIATRFNHADIIWLKYSERTGAH